eukprot:TRINITY_DN26571_c0_g1_i1.p1 TRINITY_DN26571_c0_g1~~TRINITY_DN26571_c0_g1_i1.p1  ORF type:complete len:591 (+),score=70.19 TRINITY_DN26571_c0_g1_i1:105-1877(+)
MMFPIVAAVCIFAVVGFDDGVACAACWKQTASSNQRSSLFPPMLMQTHARFRKNDGATITVTNGGESALIVADIENADALILAHIRSLSTNPYKVAGVIREGIQAVLRATLHFVAVPPRIYEGIVQLCEDLLVCVSSLLPPEQIESATFRRFRKAIQGLRETAESIISDIQRFIDEGSPPPLIRAIGGIIGQAAAIAVSFLPPQTSVEVSKYLNAVQEALETMGTSWDEFAKGNTVKGIEAVYWGLRSITDGLMPDSVKADGIYKAVIGTLDNIIGNLSKTVLSYERHIMESSVCWRFEKSRERERPTVCPTRYVWDGSAYCYPLLSLSLDEVTSAASSAMTLSPALQSPQHYAIPAKCEVVGNNPVEKHGDFCYAPCPGGMHVKNDETSKCISSCEGRFPAETPQMCGRDQGIVIKAILEMVTTVLNSAFTVAENIIRMKNDGVDAESLTSTINAFIEMGKPFANPTCPSWTRESTVSPSLAVVCQAECNVGSTPGACRLESGGLTICLPSAGGFCAAGQLDCAGALALGSVGQRTAMIACAREHDDMDSERKLCSDTLPGQEKHKKCHGSVHNTSTKRMMDNVSQASA